jgi:hypothetical protein
MGRQRREQRTAIDEDGSSPEGITDGSALILIIPHWITRIV